MHYQNTISYLKRIQDLTEKDPDAVSKHDLSRLISLYQASRGRNVSEVDDLESEFASDESQKWEDPIRSKTNFSHLWKKNQKWSEKPHPDAASEEKPVLQQPYPAAGNSLSKELPLAPAPFFAPSSQAGGIGSSATNDGFRKSGPVSANIQEDSEISSLELKNDRLREWNIDAGTEDPIEELNSIEILSALILARLKERYVES